LGTMIRRWAMGLLAAAATLGAGRAEAAPPMLRVLVVGDRWDADVGEDVKVDVDSVDQVFQFGLGRDRFRMRAIERFEFTRDGILRAIAGERVDPDDALMVLVMAHGAFDPRSGAYLELDGRGPLFASELAAAIRARGNRLGVLMYESCQRVRPLPFPGVAAPAAPALVEKPLFRTLFLESRGFVEMHAAKPGELAVCLPSHEIQDERGVHRLVHNGSLFMQSFVNVLWMNAARRDAGWRTVAEMIGDDVRQRFADKWPTGLEIRAGFGPLVRRQPTQSAGLRSPAPAWASYSTRVGLTVEETGGEAEVVVTRVHPGGPGVVGLTVPFFPGDTIAAIDGKPIRDPADFARAAAAAGPRAVVQGRQIQDGKDYSIDLALADGGGAPGLKMDRGKVFFGTSLVPDARGGLRVVMKVPGSTAEANNYVEDTRILEVDGRPMRSREDFDRAMRDAGVQIRVKGVTYWGEPFTETITVRRDVGSPTARVR